MGIAERIRRLNMDAGTATFVQSKYKTPARRSKSADGMLDMPARYANRSKSNNKLILYIISYK